MILVLGYYDVTALHNDLYNKLHNDLDIDRYKD